MRFGGTAFPRAAVLPTLLWGTNRIRDLYQVLFSVIVNQSILFVNTKTSKFLIFRRFVDLHHIAQFCTFNFVIYYKIFYGSFLPQFLQKAKPSFVGAPQ